MLPACVAFEECLNFSKPSDHESSEFDPLVIHVCIFRESSRRANITGGQLRDEEQKDTIRLLTKDPVRIVRNTPVLQNTLVNRLSPQHFSRVIFGVAVLFLAFTIWDPGYSKTQVPDPNGSNAQVTFYYPSIYSNFAKITLCWVLVFLALHATSADIIKVSCQSFHTGMIILMSVCVACILIHEQVQTRQAAEVETTTFQMCFVALWPACEVLLAFLVDNVDALMMPLTWKLLSVLVYFAGAVYTYINGRFMHKWSSYTTCHWISCTSVMDIFLTAQFHIIVFTFKILLRHFQGDDFAVLTSRVVSTLQPVPLPRWLSCPFWGDSKRKDSQARRRLTKITSWAQAGIYGNVFFDPTVENDGKLESEETDLAEIKDEAEEHHDCGHEIDTRLMYIGERCF